MQIRPVSGPRTDAAGPTRSRPSEAPTDPQDSLAQSRPAGSPAQGGTLSGDIRVHEVHSQVLGNDRKVWVYLPPAYHTDPKRKFPVLYMQDGQNVFDASTSFGGVEWGADEAAERLIRSGRMQDTIIVAVSNTAERMAEYTPVKDPQHGGGRAADYAKFLVDEVKPLIDSSYRTLKGPETTGVMGSSLGGLVSLYLGFNNPGTFGLVGALSPSLWWAGKDFIRATAQQHGPGPQKIWLDMGTDESQDDDDHNGVPDVLDDLRAMGGVLWDKGYQPGKTLLYHEIPGGQHNEASWSRRVDDVLAALYPTRAASSGE